MPKRKYSVGFKSRVALEAIKGQKRLAELSKEYGVSVNQISLWKQEAIRNIDLLFGGDRSRRGGVKEKDSQIRDLRAKVGELTMERDFFEQTCKMVSWKQDARSFVRKGLKDSKGREISVSRQCRYLGISRSTFYYKKYRKTKEGPRGDE